MRAKVMEKGAETLSELELLEMILYAGSPRRDTKPIAKDLIRHFGSLSAVLRTPQAQLITLDGVVKAAISAIRIVEAAGLHFSHSDIRNRLIAEETLSRGTVDQTPVCVREVINSALKHHAKAVILVHNHPSGKREPSRADIDMTAELKAVLALVTVTLHDHLIVAGQHVASFKSLGLL